MKKFKILPSPLGLCRAKRLSIVLREVFLGKSEACAIEKGVRRTEGVISEDQRSGGQKGFWEGRKLGGQEDRLVNKTSPRPLREREEFVSERSELTNSGEGLKECKLFNDSSLNDILLKSQNDTALSPYSPIAISPSNKKAAFTLAEVLITLGVIGIVAAISLPRFIDNMTQRANSERHANIAQKVTQAMEQMRAHGLLNTSYPTTEAFVDELQNYLKIAKRCDKDHIADCWPTKTVTACDGEQYNISTIRNGKRLKLQTSTNNVGLVLADGVSIILNYDPSAKTIDIGDKITANTVDLPVGNGKSKNFAYTSDVTNSIDFIMDVNGGKKPNSETVDNKMHDIRSFNFARLKGCAGTDVIGIGCVVQVKTYQPITDPEESEYIATYCEIAAQHCRDYWLSAVNACKKLGDNYELPSKSVLNAINNQKNIYTTLPQDGIYWSSSTRNSHTGFYVDFTNSSNRDYDVFSAKHGVLCVGD